MNVAHSAPSEKRFINSNMNLRPHVACSTLFNIRLNYARLASASPRWNHVHERRWRVGADWRRGASCNSFAKTLSVRNFKWRHFEAEVTL